MGLIKPVKVSAGSGDGTSIYTAEIYTQGGKGVPVTLGEPDEKGRKSLTIDAWMDTNPADIVSGKKVVTNEGIVDGTHVCSGGGIPETILGFTGPLGKLNLENPIKVVVGYVYSIVSCYEDYTFLGAWVGFSENGETVEAMINTNIIAVTVEDGALVIQNLKTESAIFAISISVMPSE